jgi:hypothetical protein
MASGVMLDRALGDPEQERNEGILRVAQNDKHQLDREHVPCARDVSPQRKYR